MTLTLTGTVDKIIYHDPTSGYGVVVFDLHEPVEDAATGEKRNTVVMPGTFHELVEGLELQADGDFVTDRRHGRQFKAVTVSQIMPTDEDGIERYLASGMVAGVGPTLAGEIVRKFGKDTLDVLENDPGRLEEVCGIGQQKATTIAASWREQRDAQQIIGLLSRVDLSMNIAMKILKKYGASQAVEIVQNNPYQLMYDINGIGFKKADALARKMGVRYDAEIRVQAAILFALSNAAEAEGHVYLPRPILIERVLSLIGLSLEEQPIVEQAIDQLLMEFEEKIVAAENDALYLGRLFRAEDGACRHIQRLLSAPPWKLGVMQQYLPMTGDLNPDQVKAIEMALTNPVSVLTGGPGTGKSYTMKALIQELEKMGKRPVLCAPTGRAAKRLTEYTGKEAKTIHRTIGFIPGQDPDEEDDAEENAEDGKRDIDKADFVIVDEASMIDISLANRLLKAVPTGAHLLLVGDVDQLPPVGPGNFLRDLIDSGVVPLTTLDQIYRQEADSNIITNAHAVNRGEMPPAVTGDFFVLKTDHGAGAADQVVSLVKDRLPGYNNLQAEQIQVLTPMHKGAAGVTALNERLQETLNPPSFLKPEMRLNGTLFRVGDRVMQTRNDYDRGVFNGDVGRLIEINLAGRELIVEVEGRGITYPFQEADPLVLAYASTVHKAQGSEYPCVILVMLTEQHIMLQRNLLYTGITRAKKLCVMLSNDQALRIAVKNNRVARRFTGLTTRLRQ